MRDEYDSPGKEILEAYLPEFLAFFFPEAYREIDWSRGYESLDKELEQIARDAVLGKRLADKLFKVWLRNGEARIVLIHVEIQGERDTAFEERMFVYNVRAFDRYRQTVVSLAVLAGDSSGWRPGRFRYGAWGSQTGLEFPAVKVRDYNERWAQLEHSDNPFALVVMAHLKTRATRTVPLDRLHWKTQLVRDLYRRGFERQAIVDLFRFIDWVLALPKEMEQRFWDEVKRIEAEKKVQYVTTGERIGIRKGEALLLQRLLIRRFGPLPEWAEQRLREAEREDVEAWSDRLLAAGSIDEVFGGKS